MVRKGRKRIEENVSEGRRLKRVMGGRESERDRQTERERKETCKIAAFPKITLAER